MHNTHYQYAEDRNLTREYYQPLSPKEDGCVNNSMYNNAGSPSPATRNGRFHPYSYPNTRLSTNLAATYHPAQQIYQNDALQQTDKVINFVNSMPMPFNAPIAVDMRCLAANASAPPYLARRYICNNHENEKFGRSVAWGEIFCNVMFSSDYVCESETALAENARDHAICQNQTDQIDQTDLIEEFPLFPITLSDDDWLGEVSASPNNHLIASARSESVERSSISNLTDFSTPSPEPMSACPQHFFFNTIEYYLNQAQAVHPLAVINIYRVHAAVARIAAEFPHINFEGANLDHFTSKFTKYKKFREGVYKQKKREPYTPNPSPDKPTEAEMLKFIFSSIKQSKNARYKEIPADVKNAVTFLYLSNFYYNAQTIAMIIATKTFKPNRITVSCLINLIRKNEFPQMDPTPPCAPPRQLTPKEKVSILRAQLTDEQSAALSQIRNFYPTWTARKRKAE